MQNLLAPFRQSKLLNALFLSNIFLSIHYALIIYINSSFLSLSFSETQVSSLYIIGSIINTFALINASKILEKIGRYKFVLYAISFEFMATVGMMLSSNHFLTGFYFLLHLVTISLILFNLDILIESASTDESKTGGIRATYLTITNITIVVAPMLVSLLLFNKAYSHVYLVSALFILPMYYFIRKFKNADGKPILHIRLKETMSEYVKDKSLHNIFMSNFLLQAFYAYMIVYMPMYLYEKIGFSWSEIGIMFTIMLVPFVLFELPIGEMEDGKYGEKEFLTVGFVIMGLSTLFMSFITLSSFWIWTVALFISRIGASFVEISSESYFFKRVNQEKTDVISFFRITRPLSFIITPLVATISLAFVPFQYIFIIIGAGMVIGTYYSLALDETK